MDREKAVAVARDVIERLDSHESFTPLTGRYLSTPRVFMIDELEGKDLQDFIPEIERSGCQVCALGGLLFCKAVLYDEVPALIVSMGHATRYSTVNALSDVFDTKTLDLVEAAFEQSRRFAEDYQDEAVRAEVFGKQYEGDRERMRAIMENIVANNGEFIPPEV